jgi:sulfite reductase (NADPH) flavoprotein alpha-component
VIITSTYGNGEPPANANEFYAYLESLLEQGKTTALENVRFAICGLGDRTFQNFANAGKMFDALLEKLGAQRMIDRVDCDDDYEDQFELFQEKITQYLTK